MVRGLSLPALWMRGSPTAAEHGRRDDAKVDTIEVSQDKIPPLPGKPPDGVNRGGASTSSAALRSLKEENPTASGPALATRGIENGVSLNFCGAASLEACTSDDDVDFGDLRSSLGVEEANADPLFSVVYCPGGVSPEAAKSCCKDYDLEGVATAATAVQDADGGISDEDDAVDCDSSISRDSVTEHFDEEKGFCTASDGAVMRRKQTGFFATGVIILKSFVGGAFLFLPHAVMKAGYLLSLITLALVFLLAVYCMTLLVKCCETNEKSAAKGIGGSDRKRERKNDAEDTKRRGNDLRSRATEIDSEKTEEKSRSREGGIDSFTSFRRLLQPSQRFWSGVNRKCSSSSCSNDSTTTAASGVRICTDEVEEGAPQKEDKSAAAAVERQQEQLSSSGRQQQVADDVAASSLKQQNRAGGIFIDGEGATDRKEISVGTKQNKYMCEVVVTELRGGKDDVKSHTGIAEVDCAAEEEEGSSAAEKGKEEVDVTVVASEIIEAAAADVAEAATSLKETTSQAMLCSYEGVARVACGLWGERLIEACVALSQLSFATVNVVLVAGNVRDVIWTAADCAPAYNISVKAIIWAAGLLYVPLCMLRRMRHLVPLALVANVGTAAALVLLLISVSLQLVKRQQQEPAVHLPLARWSSWPLILGTSVYLWEGAGLVLPIRQEAKQSVQKRFSAFFSGSLACVLLLYIGYSLICCFAFPEELQIIILFNLASGWESLTVQSISALAVLATYPLMMLPALSIVERHLLKRKWIRRMRSSRQKFLFYVVRGIFALLTLGVATLGMRQLDDFVALIGGLCGAPLVFVFPVYFHMRLVEESTWRKVFHCCVITLGLAIQCFSLYWSVASWKGGSDFAARCVQRPPLPSS